MEGPSSGPAAAAERQLRQARLRQGGRVVAVWLGVYLGAGQCVFVMRDCGPPAAACWCVGVMYGCMVAVVRFFFFFFFFLLWWRHCMVYCLLFTLALPRVSRGGGAAFLVTA
jgi:hypothetical protein